jgi:type II secretory pathway pseudopilin PulG
VRAPVPQGARSARGTTLLEVTLVTVVLGVLLGQGLPRFERAGEQVRVDAAAAGLRSLWLAQRLHWLEAGTFADELDTLSELRLVDATVAAAAEGFVLEVLDGDAQGFAARALRVDSGHWTGELTLDESGAVQGFTQDAGGQHVQPAGS